MHVAHAPLFCHLPLGATSAKRRVNRETAETTLIPRRAAAAAPRPTLVTLTNGSSCETSQSGCISVGLSTMSFPRPGSATIVDSGNVVTLAAQSNANPFASVTMFAQHEYYVDEKKKCNLVLADSIEPQNCVSASDWETQAPVSISQIVYRIQ